MSFLPRGGSTTNHPQNTDSISASCRGTSKSKTTLPRMSRPVKKTSLFYFNLYRISWQACFISLPFDFLLLFCLPLVQEPFLDGVAISALAQVCLLLIFSSFTWFYKNWILLQLSEWKAVRSKLFNFLEKHPALIVVFLIALIGAEVYLKVGQFGILSAVLTAVIVIGAIGSAKKALKERLSAQKRHEEDLSIQVEDFNLKLFLVHFLPLLSARICVLICSLVFPLSVHLQTDFLVCLCVGCIMLSVMQAEEENFMITCRSCGTKSSRFLESYEACLKCVLDKQLKSEQKQLN